MSATGNTLQLPASAKFYPLLLVFFAGSGAAALVYEIVWFQLLEFVIGSTAASMAVLLGTFMGGMCIGSLGFARLIPASFHPLKVYAAIEGGIGLIAILVLFVLPPAADLYSLIGGSHGFTGILARALLCVLFLLPPTILMGATLPCAARFVESTPKGVSWLGILYTGNLAGAVIGCLLAGFYLLRLYDMATATFAAAAINAILATFAFLLASAAPYEAPAPAPAASPEEPRLDSTAVYIMIALSGLTALGAQVVWTRLLSLLLGASVYTFSIVLAVFLLGLGLGSSVGSMAGRSGRNPLALLGWCQALLIVAIAWAAFSVNLWLPFWPVDPRLSLSPWLTFQLDLARCLWAILPAACLWGASFPLALAAAAPQHRDPGRMVGAVYAANTIGAIVGAVAFSVILIPAAGTLWAQRILIIAAALAVLPALIATPGSGWRLPRIAELGAGAAVAAVAAMLVYALPPVAAGLYAFGRTIMNQDYPLTVVYTGEGINSSIAVSKDEEGSRYFHVAGKTEAGSDPNRHAAPAHARPLASLVHPKPRSVLVVGCGAGVTAGSFLVYPERRAHRHLRNRAAHPQKDRALFQQGKLQRRQRPAREIVYDDARHFVLTTKEKFDVITSDPIHPWVKGAATRFTRKRLFRAGETASESRRSRDAMGSAL